MTCPKCEQPRAHRSHRKGLRDYLYRYFQMIPYRCRNCGKRFYAYRAGETSSRLRTREERKIMELRRRLRWKKSKRQLAAYAVGVIALIAILYSLMQQRFE
jgi:hypothetical protein